MAIETGSLVQLSPDHDQATTQTNTTGVWSWFAKFTVPEGVEWVIESGTLLIAKLKQTGGTEITAASELALGYKSPGDDRPQLISPSISYRKFSNLSYNQQSDKDYQTEDMKIFMSKAEAAFKNETPFYLMVKSSDAIDTSEAGTYADFNVKEYVL